MSLTNLFRDQLHVEPFQEQIEWSVVGTIGNNCWMNSTGIVNQTKGMVWNIGLDSGTINATQVKGAGLLMTQPIVDATPYRIKARIGGTGLKAWAFVGYAQASPTGTKDLVQELVAWPIALDPGHPIGVFDEIVLVPGLQENDPYADRPLAFGLLISDAPNNVGSSFNISVQNLSKTAPQFAASMS